VLLNRGRARTSLAASLIAVALAVPTATHAGDVSTPRIDNFGRINANYYRGAQPNGRDYADLAALGVKTLIDLTSDDAMPDEAVLTAQAGMTYLHIPMTTREAPTPAQLSRFLEVVNDPAHQPVYVHCVGGRHRTGVMTAVYRMTQDGWSSDRAFKEMKQYKFGADFLHPELKAFVYDPRTASAHTPPAVTTKAGG
jgi:uncharacterized protein (TIGR01244 family)